jgi:putative ABC transport system ATP-binding protein
MLTTEALQFAYDNGRTFEFPNINLKAKESLLILGNSGTGKTTFLNLIGLLQRASAGKLEVNQKLISELGDKELADFRAQNIGIVFQKPYFVNALNVLDNLLLSNYLSNKTQNIQKAKELAERLGFETLLRKNVQELSGGEQQRVCIARSLMNDPKLILADEPTSALDDHNCEKVADLLESQSKIAEVALVIVTHDHRLKSRFNNQITL